jgi:S13-like H2TH domain
MPGAAGTGDPHLEQAMLAQLPPVSYLSRWQRGNSTPPPSPAPAGTAAAAPPAAQGQASPRGRAAQAGSNGRAAQAAGPGHGAHPKPVAPALKPGEREAGRLKALQMTQERKQIRDQLRQGSLSLAQALAQDGEAARGMRVMTVVRALPGVGAATAARLMREAGIGSGRRAGALTAGQRERLVATVAVVDAELAACCDRRTEHASPVLRSRAPG